MISLLAMLLLSSSFLVSIPAKSTILPGQSLGFSDNLTSPDGNFVLSFFQSSGMSYLGVNFSVSQTSIGPKAVWVANRDSPLSTVGVNLTMDADGVLKIVPDAGSPIPLNPTQASRNSSATLFNSGNLVISELDPNGTEKQILWQSFDYPTDTLLAGMKIGANFKTGKNWLLSSDLSKDVPATGGLSLEWNGTALNGAGELVIKRLGQVYWTSGAVTENQIANSDLLSIDSLTSLYNFSVVSNADESYFSYSVASISQTLWVLSYDGFRGYRGNLMVYIGVCEGDNISAGCMDPQPPSCRSQGDSFELRIWTSADNNTFTQDNSGKQEAIYILKVHILKMASNRSSSYKWWIWIIVGAATVFLVIVLLNIMWRKRLRDKEREEENIFLELTNMADAEDHGHDQEKGGGDGGGVGKGDLRIFAFVTIKEATNDFAAYNKLGQGGFGPVYKGRLPEGQEIAVKRLSRSSGQGLVEFRNELVLIAKLQHMNLVRLLGCCVKDEEKMLVYEYMPNKSLDSFIFDEGRRGLLNWKCRYSIIEGIAQGILYLHKYSRLRIIHRDLKASNILLDEDMQPKISDFGMARIFGRDVSEANTMRVVGTYGYMSPEYAMEGNFSEKSDVYSFGVLLLEIVSGRRNSSFALGDRTMNLLGYAWELWTQGRSIDLKDPTLTDFESISEIQRCIHVGLLCVQEHAADRPSMLEIVVPRQQDRGPSHPKYSGILKCDLSHTEISKQI
ncbi:hypothetical protein MLD38_021715 [Melastoma candidum]|uniref:Uncharacterized protein n=1 Tax=Melastoma candidum TaxID=119954 RepID=A0ACB9QH11_9MYRT|nr:hypothetical protein MLD38_021715 [Melastoma candidum]